MNDAVPPRFDSLGSRPEDEPAGAAWTPEPRHGEPEVVDAVLVETAPRNVVGVLMSLFVSWTLIVALIGAVLVLNSLRGQEPAPALATSLELMQANWIGKVLVAYREAAGPRAHIDWGNLPLSSDNWGERCALAILRNELDSPTAALRALAESKIPAPDQPPITPEQERLSELLRRLFVDYENQRWNAPNLTSQDREALLEHFGWFGRLALHPRAGADGAARQAVLSSCLIALAATALLLTMLIGLLIGGLIGGSIALALLLSRRIRFRFPVEFRQGHIYVETFAVWFLLFLVFTGGASAFDWGRYKLLVAGGAFFASLLALAWPVFRGVPWVEVRKAIGWTRGTGIVREACAGVLGYVCCFPILLAGLFLFFVAFNLAGLGCLPIGWAGDQVPSHPLGGELLRGDPLVIVSAYLVACIAAPLIEETAFRGVLYRHLREMSGEAARGISACFAAGLNGLIFAVIHPQGWMVVPALAALGINFSLVREWRDSLIGSITIHALHNATLITAFVFIFTW